MSTAQTQETKKTVSGYQYDSAKQTLTVWGRVHPDGYNTAKRALDDAEKKLGSREKALETLTVEMRKTVTRIYDFSVTLTGIVKPEKHGDFFVYALQSGVAVAVAKPIRAWFDEGKTNSEINTLLFNVNFNGFVPTGARNAPTKAEKQVRTVQAMTAEDIAKALTPEQLAAVLAMAQK